MGRDSPGPYAPWSFEGSRRYLSGSTVHGVDPVESDGNSGGHVVTLHAAVPGMLSPQFPVPETSLQKSAGAPLRVMFPLNRLRKTLLLLELKISQPHVSSEEGLGFEVLPNLVISLSDAQFPLAP